MGSLKYDDVRDVIYGATLLGAGGGGSMKFGLKMLEAYVETHGGPDCIKVSVCSPKDMDDGAYAAVTAAMGAPTKIPGDFSPWVLNAFNFYSCVQSFSQRNIQYSMAVELGGFNTFIPMLVSMEKKLSLLDVDGSARAVPALTTLLFNVNGYNTLPIALADYIEGSSDFAKVLLDFPKDAQNAALAEDAARAYLSTEMNQIAGLCGWMIKKEDFSAKRLPFGSISLAAAVGNVLRTTPAADVFSTLTAQGIVKNKGISGYSVADGSIKTDGGFDKGYVLFYNKSGGNYFRFDFQNETLLVSYGSDPTKLKPLMTAPDIICSFQISDLKDGNIPLTNADYFDDKGNVKKGLEVMLGLIQVSDVWWYSGYNTVNKIWQQYFTNVGYTGDIIQFGSAVKAAEEDGIFDQ
ncbi:MAG: DUF917 domain-containing protein [Clostridium sp.]|jgi:DUF917 family protein|nr:DUF917 domain-containing protein [Clostridium sp.]